eukprot:365341-Chlamydomonas_euryale.AAC.2
MAQTTSRRCPRCSAWPGFTRWEGGAQSAWGFRPVYELGLRPACAERWAFKTYSGVTAHRGGRCHAQAAGDVAEAERLCRHAVAAECVRSAPGAPLAMSAKHALADALLAKVSARHSHHGSPTATTAAPMQTLQPRCNHRTATTAAPLHGVAQCGTVWRSVAQCDTV